jgi:hypothetical protein
MKIPMSALKKDDKKKSGKGMKVKDLKGKKKNDKDGDE